MIILLRRVIMRWRLERMVKSYLRVLMCKFLKNSVTKLNDGWILGIFTCWMCWYHTVVANAFSFCWCKSYRLKNNTAGMIPALLKKQYSFQSAKRDPMHYWNVRKISKWVLFQYSLLFSCPSMRGGFHLFHHRRRQLCLCNKKISLRAIPVPAQNFKSMLGFLRSSMAQDFYQYMPR